MLVLTQVILPVINSLAQCKAHPIKMPVLIGYHEDLKPSLATHCLQFKGCAPP